MESFLMNLVVGICVIAAQMAVSPYSQRKYVYWSLRRFPHSMIISVMFFLGMCLLGTFGTYLMAVSGTLGIAMIIATRVCYPKTYEHLAEVQGMIMQNAAK